MQNHPRLSLKLMNITVLILIVSNLTFMICSNPENWKEAKSIYDFSAKTLDGETVSLEKYRGHVCIVVNVASECAYAKNHYNELNELYANYSTTKGLRILGFPCNQFGWQEPGDSETISTFIKSKNVKFDMYEKIDVNGDNAHPLWNYLKHKQGGTLGDFIKWNFSKFIIDKNGQPVARYGPSTSPKELVPIIAEYCLTTATALFAGVGYNKLVTVTSNPQNFEAAKSIFEFSAKTLKGEEVSLEKYRGHVCIIVNVACECGYTKKHYEELNELYKNYSDKKGLRILGFPSNQFGQEPGDSDTISDFAKAHNVKFDMYEKIELNGDKAHPLWKYLQHKEGGTLGNFIKWNFTKFIIDKNGQPVGRYGPQTTPKELVSTLEKYW